MVVGKFGKLPAVIDPQAKLVADITDKYRLTPPRYYRVDWSRKLNVPTLGTLLNTQIGCCTCSSKGHDIQLWTAWTGVQAVIPDADILHMYEAISGYNGTHSTDTGATIKSSLDYWLAHGLSGHKLDGYGLVEPGDLDAMRAAIWIFGSVDIGLMLPRTCIPQVIWRVVSLSGDGAPGSAGGHDVNVIGYDDHKQLFTCITWGHLKYMSYSFWKAYCDEAYALASKEWLLKNVELTPSDVSWDQVIADLNG
jgi:hypothetical protein